MCRLPTLEAADGLSFLSTPGKRASSALNGKGSFVANGFLFFASNSLDTHPRRYGERSDMTLMWPFLATGRDVAMNEK
jgi:hypothetical protein